MRRGASYAVGDDANPGQHHAEGDDLSDRKEERVAGCDERRQENG